MSEEFDFDFFMNAYKEDPEGYEELAKAYVHRCIDDMTDDEEKRNRLKGVYWQCVNDPEIRKCKNAYLRAQRASTMMWVKFREMDDLLQTIVRGTNEQPK